MLKFSPVPVLVCLLLVGCTLGPDYLRPNVTCQLPAGFDLPAGWKLASPADESSLDHWWQRFGDPALNNLIEDATEKNFEIAAALHRVEQARALCSASRSPLFPQLDFDPSARRMRMSETRRNVIVGGGGRGGGGGGGGGGINPNFTDLSLPLMMNWEIDLWGETRRTIEAARSETKASMSALRQVRLLVQTELATRYFEVRAADAQIDLFDKAIELRKAEIELNRKRFEAGDTNEVDVSRAETQLYETEAQLLQAKQDRQQLENALALLTGKPSSGFRVAVKPLVGEPPQIPANVPCELLERRPDIARAERVMMAENARIGVARAAFFPTINISGSFGLESGVSELLFDPASRIWSAGFAAMTPVFRAGANRAGLKRAEARYEETVALYRQSILTAVREVDDALVANARLAEQAAALDKTIRAANRTVELTQSRYRAGIDTYFQVVDALRTALNAEQSAVRILSARYVAAVSLVKAVGGGWECPAEAES